MTRPPPNNPLIAVIGATGTGKSQLAVELAKRYNGEIINGDAMQLYAGLPIITNKITAEEQQGIPHNLLGCIGLHEQTWVVGTFVKKALGVMEDIRSRGKLPILVGGTHYYTQSLLFRDRLAEKEGGSESKEFVPDTKQQWPILDEPTEVLLDELRRIDPVMADRWHPNDRRKIQRSLEIYLQTGKKASDVYAEQRQLKAGQNVVLDGDGHAGAAETSMRFPALIFWVHAQNDSLRDRLDGRVSKMMADGLLGEVRELSAFAEGHAADGVDIDETRGIWVSIGYKEFKAYTTALQNGSASDQELRKLKAEAIERTQIATRQYAKRQLRWIRIKLVNALASENASNSLYLLDGSDISHFDPDVVGPALELTRIFLNGSNPMPDPASMSSTAKDLLTPSRDYDLAATPEKWTRQHCELCGVTCITEEQWGMHVKSKAHRKLKAKAKKADETEARQKDTQANTATAQAPVGKPP
ncbi:tRNA dimethylallyltransferase, mitochondrial [Saxophila tyrrhenica]|uniref:tRNA dimethylallyltransferase n=1 Tax=Saxophila tyrrhenica TaxID=1690608 RepID=A0AAV9P5N4_9PEZI|nr:tRNA dimethylallyltransferase, mitochondrial [Saxophila tyrrhenica]